MIGSGAPYKDGEPPARAAGSAVRRAEKGKTASFEEDTVVPLSAAYIDGGSAASSGLPLGMNG